MSEEHRTLRRSYWFTIEHTNDPDLIEIDEERGYENIRFVLYPRRIAKNVHTVYIESSFIDDQKLNHEINHPISFRVEQLPEIIEGLEWLRTQAERDGLLPKDSTLEPTPKHELPPFSSRSSGQ